MSENSGGEELQFQRAEAIVSREVCVVCKNSILATYFHVGGNVVCSNCTARIEAGQQAPPAISLAKAALYGGGAALAGCAIYATVALVTGLEIGLIAILVGVMVGKAIRHASGGLGGRPQQVLAVVLTYFAITTSYIPVFIKHAMDEPKATAAQSTQPKSYDSSIGTVLVMLIALAAAAPFLSLSDGSGILSIAIIGFGLYRAWKLTERTNLLVMGPYTVAT